MLQFISCNSYIYIYIYICIITCSVVYNILFPQTISQSLIMFCEKKKTQLSCTCAIFLWHLRVSVFLFAQLWVSVSWPWGASHKSAHALLFSQGWGSIRGFTHFFKRDRLKSSSSEQDNSETLTCNFPRIQSIFNHPTLRGKVVRNKLGNLELGILDFESYSWRRQRLSFLEFAKKLDTTAIVPQSIRSVTLTMFSQQKEKSHLLWSIYRQTRRKQFYNHANIWISNLSTYHALK